MTAAVAPPTQECGTFDLGCRAGQAVGSVFDSIVNEIARGAADLIVATSTWWAETDSIDPRDSAVLAAQGATRGLILLILVGSVLVQAIRLIISRKAEPLIVVVTGLFRFAAVSALGLTVLQAALAAGDDLAAQLLDGAANNFALFMRDVLTSANTNNAFLVLLVSVVAAVMSLVQWLLMAMRQAGLLVLAAMLPLAAAGSLTKSTRGWLDKLIPWLIAMVVYKPAAAFIYYIGFSYLSSPSSNDPGGIGTMITGVMVLLLAVIAMPVLLKFFSWSGTQMSGSGGGGSGFIGAAGAAAMAQGYRQSPAVARAGATEATGPGSMAGAPRPAGAAPGGAAGGGAAAAGVAGAAVAAVTAAAAATRGTGQQMTGNPDGGGPR